MNPPSVPSFNVSWYEKGGVFDAPTTIGVGENGQEAVMPLERNTGWIGQLATMITSEMANSQFVPVGDTTNNNLNSSEDKYMTQSVVNNNTTQGNTDNSVTFAEGAIQIQCQNASEAEALKMAKKIMELIKRQNQLDKMLAYG